MASTRTTPPTRRPERLGVGAHWRGTVEGIGSVLITRFLSGRAKVAAAAVYAAMATAVTGVAVAAALGGDTRVKDLARDPATLSGAPASDGLLTWLSAFAWSATIAVVLLGGWVLGRIHPGSRRRRFLHATAIATAVLAVDDVFLVHERLAPAMGLAEEVLFAAYAIGFALFVRGFRDVLVVTEVRLLALAVLFFGATLLVAYGPGQLDPPFWLLPDTYTFLGVGGWFAYHLHTVVSWLEDALAE